jgi:SAM-dependent methyltransferase
MLRWYFPCARSLLEIGCGTGFVLRAIQNTHPAIALTGSELHISGLVPARQRLGTGPELIQADARQIPFREEFDVVCAFDALEHILEDEAVLAEMRAAAKPGGGVLLSVPQHPLLWSRADVVAHHKRRYRRNELGEKVTRVGMRVIFQTSFVSTLLPFMILQRLLNARSAGYRAESELALPYWLDKSFEAALAFDHLLIGLGVRFGIGGSRFLVARRV